MSEMEIIETKERFNESMKRAVSRCRELSIAQKKHIWNQIADSLDGLRVRGMAMIDSKGLSKIDIDRDIELHKKIMTDRLQ